MENASKALLIAAGVLISVIVLSLLVATFISFKSVSDAYDERMTSQGINQFNTQFTKYLDKELSAQDVYTIYQLVQKAKNEEIEIKLEGSVFTEIKNSGYNFLNLKSNGKRQEVVVDPDTGSTYNQVIFYKYKIDKIEYSNKTGLVNLIKIKDA